MRVRAGDRVKLLTTFFILCGMAVAQSQPSSKLTFFELTVSDLARAKSFYGQLFGWTFAASPSPDFVSIQGAGVSGGLLRDPSKKPGGAGVKIFFAVDDVEKKSAEANSLGAEITVPPMKISPTTALAEFRDPEGNVIGVIHEIAQQERKK